MLAILAGILLLGVCVFFHELGHFFVGKLMGVKPRVFSIGYGRALLFRRRKSTIYQITAIPLGGYVQFYGDDPSNQNRKMRKGDFFSVGPWRRMALAFGGPLFSILLGFIVVFVLLQTGYRPSDNIVRVDSKSALYKAGLRDGDRITSIDGNATASFDRIVYEVGFAKAETVEATIERGDKNLHLNFPVQRSEPGMPGMLTGARPLSRLVMTDAGPQGVELKKGDEILQANGEPLHSTADLIRILNAQDSETAELTLNRPDGNGGFKEVHQAVPLKKISRVFIKNIVDIQTEKKLPDIMFEDDLPNSPRRGESKKTYQNIFVNGESFSTYNEFHAALEKADAKDLKLRIGPVEIKAEVQFGFRRLIGIDPDERPISSAKPLSFLQKIVHSADETIFVTKSTFVGLWRIIQGKLSFNKSVSGPVKMVAIAAKTVELGWQTYFLLMAQITIILGVMNLLPIPVLDGGHILFYFIEAVYKPLSFKVQATATRIGMAVMLAMGIYVIGLDILDVFVRRVFG